ncbi:pentatricopeptide repeat-containing protein-like [Iris pallida]|uniref:Pentatricopeptide repeat-containing protein-like n=1 Tax=Iris pallida TaxID=29817 RepID=A0AAX6EUU2_IRIPA|nr:pentatricopeptide repeat-containing protein-like [Iris pallida]
MSLHCFSAGTSYLPVHNHLRRRGSVTASGKINPQSLPPPKIPPKPPSSLPKTLTRSTKPLVHSQTLDNLTPKEQTLILKSQKSWQQTLTLFNHFKSQPNYVPNTIHYNILLRTLGKSQKWDELRIHWLHMAKDGIFPSNNTYGTLIDVFGKAGLVKESLLWLKHMKSRGVFPDEVTMNTVVRILKDSGQFDKGEKFFKNWCAGVVELDVLDLDSGEFSPKHFLLMEMFKSGGRVPVSRIGEEGRSGRNRPRLAATYNTLIDLYGKAGRLKDASEAFREMLRSGVEPDAITFNTMINICGSHGDLSEAETLLRKMEERRIRPDTKTYNVFMSLYASIDVSGLLRYYRRITECGLRPDVVSYRIVLQVLCGKKLVREAEEVIDEVMKSGACVDEQTLPVVMKMYVDQGLLEKAVVFLEKHCYGRNISSQNYAAIIDVYAEKGFWKEAEDVFIGDKNRGRKKDVTEYNVMLKAYGKAKLYEKALSLFESMSDSGSWPDDCTYNSLIQMLSGGDLLDRARQYLGKMKEAGFRPRCETFSALVAGYSRNGFLSEAVEVYHEMKASGVEPNEFVYGSLIDGFAESGRCEDAINYFHMMEASGLSANRIVLTSLIKAYSKISCWKEAQEVYSKMKKLDDGPDTMASNCMINLCADLGMVTEAKMIFDDLRTRGQADGVSYATMMYLYKSMGLLDDATDIVQEAQSSGLLTDCASYNNAMSSYAMHGKLKDCGELLHQMLSRRILPDASTFKTLFTVLKKGGMAPEAVSQMEVSYIEGKPFARQAIITSLFSMVGFHPFALESCEAILNAGLPLDSFAYNVAIHAYGASSEVDKALNVFMKMQDEGLEPDLITYINLAACYGKAGMVEGLKRIYGLLRYGEIEPNESLYRALIDAYNDAGRDDLAQLVDQEMRFEIDVGVNSESEDRDD